MDKLEGFPGAKSILTEKLSIDDLTSIEEDVLLKYEDSNSRDDSSEQKKEPN